MGWTYWKPIENRDDDYRGGPSCYELCKQSPDAPDGTGVETDLVGATENRAKYINDLISTLKIPTPVFVSKLPQVIYSRLDIFDERVDAYLFL